MKERKKWLHLVALLSGVMLIAAACGGDEEAPQAADTSVCDQDEFGCVEIGAGEPIKVATLLVISGADAPLGLDSQNGAVMGADFLDGTLDGTPGQLLGHDIEFVHEDDGCSAEGGQAGGTKLAADPTIVAVIGTSCSSSALGVADRILSEKGIALISPSNTNSNLTAEGTHEPFYLRTAHNDKVQGAVVATFLVDELGLKSIATINDESPYADGLAATARAVFEAKGGTVTAIEAVNSADTDVSGVLTSIAEGNPDVLYFPDFQNICGLVVTQGKGIAGLEDTVLVGSDGCAGTTFADIVGDQADGMYLSGPNLSGFQEGAFYADEFLPAYEAQFGSSPTALFHAHSFDAFGVLGEAIEKVAIELDDGGLLIPRTALKDALFATSGYAGVIGAITCNELGDCAPPLEIAVYQIPTDPFVGGDPQAEPVFAQGLTVAEADQIIAGG